MYLFAEKFLLLEIWISRSIFFRLLPKNLKMFKKKDQLISSMKSTLTFRYIKYAITTKDTLFQSEYFRSDDWTLPYLPPWTLRTHWLVYSVPHADHFQDSGRKKCLEKVILCLVYKLLLHRNKLGFLIIHFFFIFLYTGIVECRFIICIKIDLFKFKSQ